MLIRKGVTRCLSWDHQGRFSDRFIERTPIVRVSVEVRVRIRVRDRVRVRARFQVRVGNAYDPGLHSLCHVIRVRARVSKL